MNWRTLLGCKPTLTRFPAWYAGLDYLTPSPYSDAKTSFDTGLERPGYIHPSLCDEGSSSFDRFFVQRLSALTKPRGTQKASLNIKCLTGKATQPLSRSTQLPQVIGLSEVFQSSQLSLNAARSLHLIERIGLPIRRTQDLLTGRGRW
jgi:hypothetical protein